MKRALALVCVLIMAICLLTSAQAAAPKGGYVLLESLKNVPASAAEISLPEGLAKPVQELCAGLRLFFALLWRGL